MWKTGFHLCVTLCSISSWISLCSFCFPIQKQEFNPANRLTQVIKSQCKMAKKKVETGMCWCMELRPKGMQYLLLWLTEAVPIICVFWGRAIKFMLLHEQKCILINSEHQGLSSLRIIFHYVFQKIATMISSALGTKLSQAFLCVRIIRSKESKYVAFPLHSSHRSKVKFQYLCIPPFPPFLPVVKKKMKKWVGE